MKKSYHLMKSNPISQQILKFWKHLYSYDVTLRHTADVIILFSFLEKWLSDPIEKLIKFRFILYFPIQHPFIICGIFRLHFFNKNNQETILKQVQTPIFRASSHNFLHWYVLTNMSRVPTFKGRLFNVRLHQVGCLLSISKWSLKEALPWNTSQSLFDI